MSNRKQASYSKPKETQQQPSEVCISFSGCIPRPHVSGYYLAKDMLHKGTIQILRIFFSSFYSFYREERWETNCAIQKLPTADKFCFPSECIAQLDSAPATLVYNLKKKKRSSYSSCLSQITLRLTTIEYDGPQQWWGEHMSMHGSRLIHAGRNSARTDL